MIDPEDFEDDDVRMSTLADFEQQDYTLEDFCDDFPEITVSCYLDH